MRLLTEKQRKKRAEYRRRYRAEHPEKRAAERQRYREKYPEKRVAERRRYRAKHIDVERERQRRWRQNRPEGYRAQCQRREIAQQQATPLWANYFFMSEIRALARLRTKLTGIEWEVDHIVPLQSNLVCGLHWEYNLQVVPAKLNGEKGNRVWPDMPGHARVYTSAPPWDTEIVVLPDDTRCAHPSPETRASCATGSFLALGTVHA